jgi:SAM-dependent methyltransferase
MQSTPISQAEINVRIHDHIDELLELWWAEQGASKPRDLDLIALSLPFARGQALRVLDLCCGPGDVGRAIRHVYPDAHIDGIDWDPFLTSICAAVNQRNRIPGTLLVRDLHDDGWIDELPGDYDVVAIVNALHWFGAERAAQLVTQVHRALRGGGVFLLAEPARAEGPFERGFEEWRATQPPRYLRENWQRFWSRANALLGYDHPALWGARASDQIGDSMSVGGWVRLLKHPGFELIDVLWRDADQVILAARK